MARVSENAPGVPGQSLTEQSQDREPSVGGVCLHGHHSYGDIVSGGLCRVLWPPFGSFSFPRLSGSPALDGTSHWSCVCSVSCCEVHVHLLGSPWFSLHEEAQESATGSHCTPGEQCGQCSD